MERSIKEKKNSKRKKTWILIIKALIVGIYDIVTVIHTYYVSIKIKSI
jgi:hypothetical protein